MLSSFYNDNDVPDSDRIKLEKNILLVVPEKAYDVKPAVAALGLTPFEVAVTWPKKTVEMLPEIMAAEPRFVLQVGCRFFERKFASVPDASGAAAFMGKALSATADRFVNLHHHDEFSIKDALGSVGKFDEQTKRWTGLMALLAAQRRSYCCITNHGSIGGWIRQYNACKQAGVKAIFGMEAYVDDYRGDDPEERRKHRSAGHLVLVARTKEGWDNIIRIHNDAWMHGFYYTPRVNKEACRKWGKGIVATSACMGGEISRLLMGNHRDEAEEVYRFYSSVFDQFYIEIQAIEYEAQRVANNKLIRFAKRVGAPLVLACDSHYLAPEHSETHDILMCIRQGKLLSDLHRNAPEVPVEDEDDEEDVPQTEEEASESSDVWAFDVRNLYYRNAEQMEDMFRNGFSTKKGRHLPFLDSTFTEEVFSEAMDNTREVAVGCEQIVLDSTIQLPHLSSDANETLVRKTEEGLKSRGLDAKPNVQEYRDRIAHEIGVITKLGWADYFLIMDWIVADAKSIKGEWAVGYGRGSAAGSLVSYCLGLTDVDPIAHGLLFERFLDEGRPDPPDIDTDFDPSIRDTVKQHIVARFGSDKVCSIGTYQTYKTKAVILDVTRVLGLDVGYAGSVTKEIDSLTQFEDEDGDSHKVDDIPFDELCGHYPKLKEFFDKNPEVRHHAEILRNQVKNMSTHAGGVIISDRPLSDKIPVLWDKPGNKESRRVNSAWAEGQDKSELSAVGLVKFDLLGLTNLPVISDCVRLIENATGHVVRRQDIPIDDRDSIMMCSKKDLVGIFQLENPSTMPVVQEVGMESLNDVSAITSLIRPGPRDMGMDMEYAHRKHGKFYDSIPCIAHIMAETYGVMTYQEQMMQISRVLCGFDGPMANKLRKACGKKIKAMMDAIREKFVAGAQPRITAGEVTLQQVEQIWDLIAAFARYSFNKSHAVCYSAISTAELWLKHHHFVEYMAAVINNSKLGKKKHGKDIFIKYINYVRGEGYRVLGPDVNKSDEGFSVEVVDGGERQIRFSLRHIKYVATQAPIVKSFQPYTGMTDFCERVKVETVGTTGRKTTRRPSRRVVESLVSSGAFDSFGKSRNELMAEYAAFRGKKEEVVAHTDREWFELEEGVIGLCLSREPVATAYRDRRKKEKWQALKEVHEKRNVTVLGRVAEVKPHVSKVGNEMRIVTLTDDLDTVTFFVFKAAIQYFCEDVKVRDGMVIAVPLSHFMEDEEKMSESIFFDDKRKVTVIEKPSDAR